jgi:hypothetical protein
MRFFFGLIIIYFAFNYQIQLSITCFIFFKILDYTDGSIARLSNNKTFYGKFIDSSSDLFIEVFFLLFLGFYFFNLLKTQVPTVKLKNTFDAINKLQPSLIESKEDTVFRLTMNTIYKDTLETFRKTPSSSITVGTDNKFGSVLPGYFILDEYFEYHCIVYPETTWQNDELTLTEKGMKCFYSECLPMPVGGSNINQLYNSLGYYTAWNLLPAKLQSYDSNKKNVMQKNEKLEIKQLEAKDLPPIANI